MNTKIKNTLLSMVSMAMHSIGIYHFPSEDETDSFEFVDIVLDIQGIVTVSEDLELVLFVMGKTDECPSDAVIKALEAGIIKPKAELFVSGTEDSNDMLYYFDNIQLGENTTITAIQNVLMKAFLSAIRSQKMTTQFYSCADEQDVD